MWPLDSTGRYEVVSKTDRRGRPLRTVICMDTGLVRNDPVPDDAELAKFYAEDYRISYKGARKPRRRQILRNFRRAATYVRNYRDLLEPTSRVLDVGAGSGEFAFLMTRLGKTVTGIEPNFDYAAYCRDELGLDVRTSHLAPDLFRPGQFDLIRMNHVLEHLNNPVRYLGEVANWLTPDGLLYVEVPNIEVDCRSKSRGRMFHYAHIFNFNPWTLRACAGLAGRGRSARDRARFCRNNRRILPPGCRRRRIRAGGESTECSQRAEVDPCALWRCLQQGQGGQADSQAGHPNRREPDRAAAGFAGIHRGECGAQPSIERQTDARHPLGHRYARRPWRCGRHQSIKACSPNP